VQFVNIACANLLVFLFQMVQQVGKLVQFLFGDFEGSLASEQAGATRGRFASDPVRNDRIRQLIPVAREYSPQLREFGTLLVQRLTEKSISRGLNWASGRLLGASPATT
jgi:hypothetical protein